jgi:hypothetical protein
MSNLKYAALLLIPAFLLAALSAALLLGGRDLVFAVLKLAVIA